MTEQQSWEPQPGERNLWVARFEAYRLAGPTRSLLGTYNAERAAKGRKRSLHPSGSWRRAFERWSWQARAEAWDEAERLRVRAEVARAQQMLREAAPDAVKALRDVLKEREDWKAVVQAAKEILNRAGLPEVTEQRQRAVDDPEDLTDEELAAIARRGSADPAPPAPGA